MDWAQLEWIAEPVMISRSLNFIDCDLLRLSKTGEYAIFGLSISKERLTLSLTGPHLTINVFETGWKTSKIPKRFVNLALTPQSLNEIIQILNWFERPKNIRGFRVIGEIEE